MKQVLYTSLVLLVAGGLSISGCSRPEAGEKSADGHPKAKAYDKPTIVVIPGAQSPEFLKLVRSGAEAAGREFRVELEWSTPKDNTEISEQNKSVYDAIAKKPTGIILSPLDRVRLLSAVNKSSKSRVPIVLLDNNVDTNFRLSLVGSDHTRAGTVAAQYIGKITGGTGKVGMITREATVQAIADRVLAFEETIAKEFPRLQIVKVQYPGSKPTESIGAVRKIITENPDVKALFTLDEYATNSAHAVITEAKLLGKVKIVGSNLSPGNVAGIKRGEIDALLVSNPYRMGYECVKALMDYDQLRTPPKRIDTGIVLLTKENMNAPENRGLLREQPSVAPGKRVELKHE